MKAQKTFCAFFVFNNCETKKEIRPAPKNMYSM